MNATVVCPFCSLLCDDIQRPGGSPSTDDAPINETLMTGLCETGRAGFRTSWVKDVGATALIDGRAVSPEAALNHAAQLIHESSRPLISGLVTDIQGMRAAIELAQTSGAVTDHLNSEIRFRNLLVQQERGAILTTFAEVRNRADLIILVGENPLRTMPRFEERLLDCDGLFVKRAERHVALVGKSPTGLPVAAQVADQPDSAALLEFLAVALMRLNNVPCSDSNQLTSADLLLRHISAARYPVFIWNAADFDAQYADMIVTRLTRLIAVLNETQRCVALPAGGNDGEASAEAVHLWRSGYAMRSEFTSDGVQYDPYHLRTGPLLDNADVDCLLWVSTLNPQQTPPTASTQSGTTQPAPTIVVGHHAMTCEADVFIPVATPGVHQAGHMVRADRVITLPVYAVQECALVDAAKVLTNLNDRVQALAHR